LSSSCWAGAIKEIPGGYRSVREWHAKSRPLAVLEARRAVVVGDWQAGRVRVVRGGKRLANARHHLAGAGLTEARWRERWEAERWSLAADGECGKRYGNETIRVSPDGGISIKLPAPLVGANADHLAAWRLDRHGNPVGSPRRFSHDLTCGADHRDAQVRHAPTRLLNWARTCRVQAIAKWGAQYWQRPTTSTTRKTGRHDAASIAIGRRAHGHPIRRRTAPPPHDRSDRVGHRTVQAGPGILGREGTRPRVPGPRTRCAGPGHGAYAGDQRVHHRSGHAVEPEIWQQDSLPLSV
jgi:hypothetical protein